MKFKNEPIKKRYSESDRDQARKYYLLGLNLGEVSKLTDIPQRTLQKWQQKESWVKLRETDNIKAKTADLKKAGLSTKEIANVLNLSYVTVWRYCKEINK